MSSETGNAFEAEFHDRVRKIRKAAAIALKELDQLRSGGPMTQEALDAEVARLAREKLQPYGCDLVVHRKNDGVTRLLIKVQSTGRGYELIKSFFHRDDGLIPELEPWLMTPDLTGKKVVVTNGWHSVGRTVAEAVAREEADVVIWLRKCNDEVNEGKVLPITLLEIPSRLPNWEASTSLWRQTMAQKSYWWSGWVTPEPYILF
jgi:hypothetical protein